MTTVRRPPDGPAQRGPAAVPVITKGPEFDSAAMPCEPPAPHLVEWFVDETTEHKMIVAIHDTTPGPALGGCRMWPYDSADEAFADAARLAEGMTLKAAMAELELGGGKAVIMGDPRTDKSPGLFRAFGRFVDSLGGRYITAEDVGTTSADMDAIAAATRHVAGTSDSDSGDPSPFTAYGVLLGIRVAARHMLGRRRLSGLRVAVQGLGAVGYTLCEQLHQDGAKLIVADLDGARAARAARAFGAEVTAPEEILQAEAEILAPCALGAVLNSATIATLRAAIVAGSANNQLARPEDGEALRRRGILYAPDYVINAGGLINVAGEVIRDRYDLAWVRAKIQNIAVTLADLFERARIEDVATNVLADQIALERIRRRG